MSVLVLSFFSLITFISKCLVLDSSWWLSGCFMTKQWLTSGDGDKFCCKWAKVDIETTHLLNDNIKKFSFSITAEHFLVSQNTFSCHQNRTNHSTFTAESNILFSFMRTFWKRCHFLLIKFVKKECNISFRNNYTHLLQL